MFLITDLAMDVDDCEICWDQVPAFARIDLQCGHFYCVFVRLSCFTPDLDLLNFAVPPGPFIYFLFLFFFFILFFLFY